LRLRLNIVLIVILIILGSCSGGRYPCPDPVEEKNSEKDGTGITLVEVKKTKNGLLKKRQPRKIRKKK
jgi:hypothetical protein